MATHSDSTRFHKAFSTIIPIYQERVSSGGLGPMELTPTTDPDQTEVVTAIVIPSTSDFICDVELAARRALNDAELNYFNKFYKSGDVVVSETDCPEHDSALNEHIDSHHPAVRVRVAQIDMDVRTKVGRRLVEVGIYPLSQYLQPISDRVMRR